jgi:DNA modification methylase
MRKEVIGDCTLYLGDCREILPTLGPIDAVITDPPYGVNLGQCGDPRGGSHGKNLRGYDGPASDDSYENFTEQIVPRLNASLDAAKRALVWSGPHIHEQRKPDAIGGVFCSAGTGRTVWGFKQFLPALLYGMSPTVAEGRGATCPTAFASSETPSADSKGHPVPKPLGWMKWSVRLASLPGQTVLDPFMGSGTTGVACAKMGRKFIGIEVEETYFNIACLRIAAAYAQPDLFVEAAVKAEQLDMLGDAS